jgi:hypothetical protein
LLNDYLFPLVGLSLLTLGAWSSWELWRPWADRGSPVPPLAVRVAALILGGVWGWVLTNLTHPLDPLHVTLGWPMPVMTLTRESGRWLELGATSIPCILLNLVIGIAMIQALLHLAWKLRPKRRPRRRAGFFDAWRVPRARPALRPFPPAPARRAPRPLAGTRVPGQRDLRPFGLEQSEVFQASQSTSRA